MIGLFLPRLRVVSLLPRQQLLLSSKRLADIVPGRRKGSFAATRNHERAGDVSAFD
ncbi:hypothetical protein SAMN05428967_1470 [Phyllobacterium sp. YR620]|nr:hypothetical protein SAMN05428967_1470 [Phyllobacterium sp. YR620]